MKVEKSGRDFVTCCLHLLNFIFFQAVIRTWCIWERRDLGTLRQEQKKDLRKHSKQIELI